MKKFLLIILHFLLFGAIVRSQSISVTGANNVNPGDQEYYEADFNYSVNPYAVISWNVSGGTIISQSVNPSTTIWCIIEWNNAPCSGSLSISEDLNNGYGEIVVDVGNYSTIQNIVSTPASKTSVNCTPISGSSCISISNPSFTPTTGYDILDPFTTNYISGWASSHGTPQISDAFHPTLQPPAPATGFAYMYSQPPVSSGQPSNGEGIAQKVKPLVNGHTYQLSFYIRFSQWPTTAGGATQLDHFYFTLLKCTDFNNFPSPAYSPPAFPSNSQTVYHGTSITNQSWNQVTVTFTANDDYDMIWAFPNQTSGGYAGVDFSNPVLQDLSDSPVLSPWGPINYYYQYESPRPVTLTASSSTNYVWYKNNQILTGINSQSYSNNLELGNINPFIGTSTFQYKVLTECGYSNTVTVNYIPCFSESDYPVTVYNNLCQSVFSSSPNYVQLYAPTLGSGTNTVWWPESALGVSPFSINSSGQLTLSGLSSYLTDGIYSKSSDATGAETYMYNVCHVSQYCKDNSQTLRSNSINLIDADRSSIHPNPARDNVIISSKEPIIQISIYGVDGILLKNYKANNSSSFSLNVSNLQSGIYVCRITTLEGIRAEKLIISH